MIHHMINIIDGMRNASDITANLSHTQLAMITHASPHRKDTSGMLTLIYCVITSTTNCHLQKERGHKKQ